MKIGEITQGMAFNPRVREVPIATEENNPFGDVMKDFIKNVNNDQNKSSQMTNDFIDGKNVELHEVMIAGEKAKTSLELLMEIRNKSIDMFRELTRMQ